MTMTANGDATVAELRSAVAGPMIVPGDNDYESARCIWNSAVFRHPAMIVRCTDTTDVVAAVRFARSEGLSIAIRGGAHRCRLRAAAVGTNGWMTLHGPLRLAIVESLYGAACHFNTTKYSYSLMHKGKRF
jgi:hypothetical protein